MQYSVVAENLCKGFKSYQKKPGLIGSLQSFVKRDYQYKEAVKSFNLSIEPGEFIGLLGPNGAGKTTLMKMLTGIIVPTSGDLKVLGFRPEERKHEFRKKIALVMGQKSQLWWDLPALDSFLLLKRFYEIPQATFKKNLNYLVDIMDVGELLNIHIRKLSLGERMKLELMASLLHSPEIVFLDEPTIGLDVVAQNNIRQFLKDYQKEKKCSIVLTSHYMADVEKLCKRLVLIIDGELRFNGKVQAFKKILGDVKIINLTFSKKVHPNEFKAEIRPSSIEWNKNYTEVKLRVEAEQAASVLKKIMGKYPILEINTDSVPIEDIMHEVLMNPKIMQSKMVTE